jgi:hypothetical protein
MKAKDIVLHEADEESVEQATRDSSGRPGDSITFCLQESGGEGPMSMSGARSKRPIDFSGTACREVGDQMEVDFFCPTSRTQVKRFVPRELWSAEQDVLECGGGLLYKKDLRRLLWRCMPSNREDYLEGEVLEALLRIFVLGATSRLGLPACRGRHHVARVTEMQQLQQLGTR